MDRRCGTCFLSRSRHRQCVRNFVRGSHNGKHTETVQNKATTKSSELGEPRSCMSRDDDTASTRQLTCAPKFRFALQLKWQQRNPLSKRTQSLELGTFNAQSFKAIKNHSLPSKCTLCSLSRTHFAWSIRRSLSSIIPIY